MRDETYNTLVPFTHFPKKEMFGPPRPPKGVAQDSDSEDSDTFGPVAPPCSTEESDALALKHTIELVEARASAPLGSSVAEPCAPKREDWMLVPPSAKLGFCTSF